MTAVTIDNSCSADLKRTITWQFDQAKHLVALIEMFKSFSEQAVRNVWDYTQSGIANIDTADAFGLSVWGKIIGIERPVVSYGNYTGPISLDLYRKILKGRIALFNGNEELGIQGNASLADYVKFVDYIFDGGIKVVDGLNMSLTFTANASLTGERKAVFEDHPEIVFVYPAGVKSDVKSTSLRFGLAKDHTPDEKTKLVAAKVGGLCNSSFTWI